MIKSALHLGQFDDHFKIGIKSSELPIADEDINDLKNLLELTKSKGIFCNKKITVDPIFDFGKKIVGRDNIDLYVNDAIVIIESSKNNKLTQKNYNRLIAYYMLSKIKNQIPMFNHISIYYSRFGECVNIPTDKIEKLITSDFTSWFKNAVQNWLDGNYRNH